MGRTLIKAVRMDDGLDVNLEGSAAELLTALAVLVGRVSEITGLSVEHLCYAMTVIADNAEMDIEKMGLGKSIDEIFDEIVGGSDL